MRHLDFLDGRIVYVASDRPEERLANWLVSSGSLPAGEVRRILGHSILEEKLLTEELVSERGISQKELQLAVIQLAGIITRGILSETELHFSFDPEYRTRDLLNLDLNLDANSLLLEAARRFDEETIEGSSKEHLEIPFEGEAYEHFFRNLVSAGVSEEESLDGHAYLELFSIIQKVMQTLARWLARSPGLVPMPEEQLLSLRQEGDVLRMLEGSPQLVWNLLVLASTISSEDLAPVETMDDLLEAAAEMEIIRALGTTSSWVRPDSPRLDQLSSQAAVGWARAAAAVAPALSFPPEPAKLAAHVLIVPTDLVLWVLGRVALPHRGLRQALLELLPLRVGQALAARASFPAKFQALFYPPCHTGLGLGLELSRGRLPGAAVWPRVVDADSGVLLEYFSQEQIREAGRALQEL